MTQKYEVLVNDCWYAVDKDAFELYYGRRRVDGEEFHGPVLLNSHYLYTKKKEYFDGQRACPCQTCSKTVRRADDLLN